jgi:hypothetical protein
MIAMDRGRRMGRLLVAFAAFGAAGSPALLSAQTTKPQRGSAAQKPATAQPAEPKTRLEQTDAPRFVQTVVPVNPTDPIAVVNGEVITRQQLADECVVRKGQEILDTLIARRVIEQALKTRKLEIGAAEIDEEIDDVAMRMAGIGREAWLRTLDKERGISPAQYARDIIYPSLALRKLANGRVQVTEKDIKDALEANFGARLHVRIIMSDKQRSAVEIWEQLKKNPGSFEKLAKDRSTDQATAAFGGLLGQPIPRHAFPRQVSDAAYQQLVDGDPKDTDPANKPKDGDFSGPIQVNDLAWVIIKRESLEPAKPYNPNDPALRATFHSQMYSAKLEAAVKDVFNELMLAASVDNRLTGAIKLANEQNDPDSKINPDDVKLMSGEARPAPGRANTSGAAPARRAGQPASARPTTPTGLPDGVANQAGRLTQPISSPK